MNSSFSMILLIVVMIVFMYFGMIRPQRKQQQKRQEMLKQLQKGDPVTTIGGLHGVIDSIDTNAGTVVLDADGIFLTFNLSAVRGKAAVSGTPQPATPAEPAAKPAEPGTTEGTVEEKPYEAPATDDHQDDQAK